MRAEASAQTWPNRAGSTWGRRIISRAKAACFSLVVALPCRRVAPAEKSRTNTSKTCSVTNSLMPCNSTFSRISWP